MRVQNASCPSSQFLPKDNILSQSKKSLKKKKLGRKKLTSLHDLKKKKEFSLPRKGKHQDSSLVIIQTNTQDFFSNSFQLTSMMREH
jgi:hypothetical protein